MLTKEQASQIADELVAQQRAFSAHGRALNERQLPLIYRCPELTKLPVRVQTSLLRRAKFIVQGAWMIRIITLVLVSLAPLAWWASGGLFVPGIGPIAILAPASVALVLLHTMMVRMVVSTLAQCYTSDS